MVSSSMEGCASAQQTVRALPSDVQQTVLDRASRDWQPDREPWLDAVARSAGAGMAVWHDGDSVTEIGRIDASGWEGAEDTDPSMERVRLSPLAVEVES